MSPGPALDFDARFDDALTRGSVLAKSSESRVVHEAPFLLAAECGGRAVDLLIHRITLLAFTLSAIVGTLVVVGAAPKPVALFVAVWFFPALLARAWARRRRSRLGRTLVDFEIASIEHVSLDGQSTKAPLAGATLVARSTHDREAPEALELRLTDGRPLRFARANERELDRILLVFRRYKVPISRDEA